MKHTYSRSDRANVKPLGTDTVLVDMTLKSQFMEKNSPTDQPCSCRIRSDQ